MTNRSSRGSGKPSESKRFVRVQMIWVLIRGLHQGQRPGVPLQQPDTWLHPTAQRHHRYLSCTSGAVHTWTRLSCRSFAANAVCLQLHALAYNLGNFMRTLAMPKAAEPWSLTSLREKLIKIGAKVVSHGRYAIFQIAEVAVPRQMFQEILSLIRPPAGAARAGMKALWVRKGRDRRWEKCVLMKAKPPSSNARRTATLRFGRRQRAFADETRCHGASTGRLWPPRTRKSGECRFIAL
jgi:hypothetical protein